MGVRLLRSWLLDCLHYPSVLGLSTISEELGQNDTWIVRESDQLFPMERDLQSPHRFPGTMFATANGMELVHCSQTKSGVKRHLFPRHLVSRSPPLPALGQEADVCISVCVTSILRVLAYNPDQVIDGTYSTVGTVTWSSVEQGLGIVCACLPTLRPLFTGCFPNRTTNRSKGESSMAMESFRPTGGLHSEKTHANSMWKDDESTVGFARLQDDEGVLSPMEMQRSVYAPVGVAISSPRGEKDMQRDTIGHSGIMKEQTIDQRSEVADQKPH